MPTNKVLKKQWDWASTSEKFSFLDQIKDQSFLYQMVLDKQEYQEFREKALEKLDGDSLKKLLHDSKPEAWFKVKAWKILNGEDASFRGTEEDFVPLAPYLVKGINDPNFLANVLKKYPNKLSVGAAEALVRRIQELEE